MTSLEARIRAFVEQLADPPEDLRAYASSIVAAVAGGKTPAQAFTRLPNEYRRRAVREWSVWERGYKQAAYDADIARERDQAAARRLLLAVLHQLQAG